MRRQLLSLGVLALLASGCAVDQGKEVRLYRKIVDIPTSQPADEFQADQPLTLRRAMSVSYTHLTLPTICSV